MEDTCTFRQSLFLSFIDKFLLVVIALGLVFLYNRFMIEHRFVNDLATHMAANRMEVLSVAWDKYYEIDALNNKLVLIFMEASDSKFKTADELLHFMKLRADPILGDISLKSSELFIYLNANRYCLGDELSLKINNKCMALHNLIRAFAAQDIEKAKGLSIILYENKPDVEQFMEE